MTPLSRFLISFLLAAACWGQTTTWGNNSGTGQFTVNLGPATIPPSAGPDNFYCTATNQATFGTTDATALLPTKCYNTALGNTLNASPLGQLQPDVANGSTAAQLQVVINAAQCGEVIKFAAGALLSLGGQSVTLPNKSCTDGHYIQLTVDTSHLPPEGQRVTPCWWGVTSLAGRPAFGNSVGGGAPCATLYGAELRDTTRGGNGTGIFVFAAGATHYRIGPGLKFTNAIGQQQNSTISLPQTDHIIFDRDWFAGDTAQENAHGISLGNSNSIAVIDSFFTDYHCLSTVGSCTDAQAVFGGACDDFTCGTYKIVDNYMEGAGECYLFGGAVASAYPSDLEIRRNWCNLPQTWNPSSPTYNGGGDGTHPWVVKNLGEFKNGVRALLEGNVRSNMWAGFTQDGFAVLITPKGQDAVPAHYAVTNITQRWEKFYNTCSGIQIANGLSDTGFAASNGSNYSLHDILGMNIGYATAYQCVAQGGEEFQLSGSNLGFPGYLLTGVTLNHLTLVGPGVALSFIVGGPSTLNGGLMGAVLTNSIWFDEPTLGTGGYGVNATSVQRSGGIVTTVVPTQVAKKFRVGATITLTGVSGDSTFNSCVTAPCATGNFTILSWNGTTTLTWAQAGPDAGPFTSQGTVGVYGCDFNNQSTPGIFTGCFNPLTFNKNIIYGPASTAVWPSTYTDTTSAGVKFVNYTGDSTGDYHLQSDSPGHNTGTDLKDIGVSDVTLLGQYTQYVDTLP